MATPNYLPTTPLEHSNEVQNPNKSSHAPHQFLLTQRLIQTINHLDSASGSAKSQSASHSVLGGLIAQPWPWGICATFSSEQEVNQLSRCKDSCNKPIINEVYLPRHDPAMTLWQEELPGRGKAAQHGISSHTLNNNPFIAQRVSSTRMAFRDSYKYILPPCIRYWQQTAILS